MYNSVRQLHGFFNLSINKLQKERWLGMYMILADFFFFCRWKKYWLILALFFFLIMFPVKISKISRIICFVSYFTWHKAKLIKLVLFMNFIYVSIYCHLLNIFSLKPLVTIKIRSCSAPNISRNSKLLSYKHASFLSIQIYMCLYI